MSLLTLDDFISRISDGFSSREPFIGFDGVGFSGFTSTIQAHRAATLRTPPTKPTGVTGYTPTRFEMFLTNASSSNTNGGFIAVLAKLIQLGTLDISGASGTYTNTASMPSKTELGATVQTAGGIYCEVTTALNATPGSFTITYTNQDGTTGKTSQTQALIASATVNSGVMLPLANGDGAVQAITAAARTAGTTPTGIVTFWGIDCITMQQVGSLASLFSTANLLGESFCPIELDTGDNLVLLILNENAPKTVVGAINIVGRD